MWTASQENWYQDDSMNLDMINRHKLILYRFESVSKEKKQNILKESQYTVNRELKMLQLWSNQTSC